MRRIDPDLLAIASLAVVMIVIALLPIPHSGMVAVVVGFALAFLWGLGEVGWQLFKDARAVVRWIGKLLRSKRPER
jgi:hypothetical protein